MIRTVLLMMVMSASGYSSLAADVKYVTLKRENVTYEPRGYRVTEVIDDRADKDGIGEMSGRSGIALSGGTANGIQAYLNANVKQDGSAQAVALRISKLNFDVKEHGGVWNVEASIGVVFEIAGKRLIEYTGKGRATLSADPATYMESFIRQELAKDMKTFDEFWAQNKSEIPVSSDVVANVNVERTTDKPGMIVYSLQRPLSISDFTGSVAGQENELAVTASGIEVAYYYSVKNSKLTLDITVSPRFNMARSWFKPEGKNPRVLAHEQAHFDITAIKTCELAETLRHTRFTEENYSKLIEEIQSKNLQDMDDEEKLYDSETNHGIITDKQLEWEKKLTNQVRSMGCYK